MQGVLSFSAGVPALPRDVPFVGGGTLLDAVTVPLRGATIVLGEPGAGKTRLLAEAAQRRRAAGTDVVAVACLAGAAHVPFDPLIALVKALHAHGRLPARAHREVAATSHAHLLQALCEAFERAASAAPLVLHVDDLHWADPHTFQAIHYCADRLRDLPLVWNLALRAGSAASDEFCALLGRAGLATIVELDGLSCVNVAALAHAIAPALALDEAAAVRLHERTGGNPLYLELLLQHGADETAPSLHRALAERLRGLTPDALAVAGSLAARDGPGTVAALAVTSHLPASRVAPALAALAGHRILLRTASGYLFRHGLVRDACAAAHGGTAPERHAADESADSPAIERLESDLADATARAPELVAELLLRLGAAHESAGDLARARSALERGIACCDAARDESLDLRLRARRAAVEGRLGNPHEGLALLEPLADRAAARGMHAEVALCALELCALAEMLDDTERYERWCRTGLEACGSGPQRAALLANLAGVALGKGQLRQALALGGAASAAADDRTSAADRARAACVQAQANAMLGDFSAAAGLLDRIERVALDPGARRVVSLACGIVNELRAEHDTALAAYTRAAGGACADGRPDVVAIAALAGMVRCAVALGAAAAARDALLELRAASRFGWTVARRYLHEADGFVALLGGNAERGCAELARAAELGHEPFWSARLLLRVADARKDRKLFLRVIEMYDAMDAPHAADAARTAARAHGLRPGRKRETQTALSAREGSVATLVATGMTNNEIGALLHITARTVEYHVGNILTKCGLRSRVEVASRIAGGQLRIGSNAAPSDAENA